MKYLGVTPHPCRPPNFMQINIFIKIKTTIKLSYGYVHSQKDLIHRKDGVMANKLSSSNWLN